MLGAGAAVLVLDKTLVSCSKDDDSPDSSNIDFTLDLNESANSVLKNKGGAVHHQNIIIAHTQNDEYIAVSDVCTHEACTVEFNGTVGFACPCHGSMFAKDGAVTNGPATRALKRYNTSLTGTMLRVYS